MRLIQIYIDEELDERLQAESAETGRSKASLNREAVSARFGKLGSIDEDPMTSLIGSEDAEPADIDETVCGS